MYKGGLQYDIETLVRLLPRPVVNGRLIVKSQNSWLIVEEYDDKEGIVVLNKITNHEGKIPYDSIREFRKPDRLILRAQVNLGRDGVFDLNPFVDGPETEILTEDEEIPLERMTFVETGLEKCTDGEIQVLKEILIRHIMEQGEINAFCTKHGIPSGYKIAATLTGRTSFLGFGDRQQVWVKSIFVPILEKKLFTQKTDAVIASPKSPEPS